MLRRVFDADDALDHVTSAADGDSSKPDPDLVLDALNKAGLEPSEAVFIGDAVWDVHASAQAGVRCLGVECGGTSAAELREAGAEQTFKDPADLLALGRDAVRDVLTPPGERSGDDLRGRRISRSRAGRRSR